MAALIFSVMRMCVFVWGCESVYTMFPWRPEEVVRSPDIVLGIKPGSSARAVRALHSLAVSPASCLSSEASVFTEALPTGVGSVTSMG